MTEDTKPTPTISGEPREDAATGDGGSGVTASTSPGAPVSEDDERAARERREARAAEQYPDRIGATRQERAATESARLDFIEGMEAEAEHGRASLRAEKEALAWENYGLLLVLRDYTDVSADAMRATARSRVAELHGEGRTQTCDRQWLRSEREIEGSRVQESSCAECGDCTGKPPGWCGRTAQETPLTERTRDDDTT